MAQEICKSVLRALQSEAVRTKTNRTIGEAISRACGATGVSPAEYMHSLRGEGLMVNGGMNGAFADPLDALAYAALYELSEECPRDTGIRLKTLDSCYSFNAVRTHDDDEIFVYYDPRGVQQSIVDVVANPGYMRMRFSTMHELNEDRKKHAPGAA